MSCDIDAQLVVIAFTSADFCGLPIPVAVAALPHPHPLLLLALALMETTSSPEPASMVGIECTKCADVALSGCVGVDEQAVVTAA